MNNRDKAREAAQRLEFFCVNSRSSKNPCGDPIADNAGNVHYTHRRLNFMKIDESWTGSVTAIFQCPVCGVSRRQKISL